MYKTLCEIEPVRSDVLAKLQAALASSRTLKKSNLLVCVVLLLGLPGTQRLKPRQNRCVITQEKVTQTHREKRMLIHG